jgi:O-antigen/teichoic acid export membrane protein
VSGILALDVCINIVVAIALARSLGVAGLGVYSVGIAVGQFLTPLLQLGLPKLLAREINRGNARGELQVIRGVMQFAFTLSLGFSLVFAMAAYLGWPIIALRLPTAYAPAIFGGLLLTPLVALTNICGGALQGWHKVGAAAASTTALRGGLMLMMLAIALTLTPGWLTPGRAVWLSVAAQALTLALTATFLLAHTLQRIGGAQPSYRIAAWRRSMVKFAAASGLMIIEQQTLTFVLATFASETQVGLYRIAQRAAGLANLGLTAIGNVIGPHIGQSHARGENARMQKLVTRSAQAMTASALLVSIGFAAFGGELLDLAVGSEFRPAYLPLVILSFGMFVRAFFGPFEMLMNMTGHEGAIIRARAVAMTVIIFAAIALMGENAAVGASVASAVGLLVMSLMMWRDARRLLDCRTSALSL